VATLSVASCHGNQDKLQPCGPPWPEYNFYLYFEKTKEAVLNMTKVVGEEKFPGN